MENFHLIRYLIAGTFRRDFIITSGGKTHFDIPGGSIPYAATGFSLWDTGLGLIGSVGEDFPQIWCSQFEKSGIDTRGIAILPEMYDLRSFIFFQENRRFESQNPIAQFSQLGLAIPKSLLGYLPQQQRTHTLIDEQKIPIQIKQIPPDYLDASTAHLCPMEYAQQNLLVSHFQNHINTISLDPGELSSDKTSLDELFELVRNIQILQVSEDKLKRLFRGKSDQTWDIIDTLASYGSEMIIVKRGKDGQFVYDCFSKKRWYVPAYPARVVDTTGSGNAFCGGFLAGYRKTYDPVEATLYGNISASFSVEGTGAVYSLGVLPGLAEARVARLRDLVKSI